MGFATSITVIILFVALLMIATIDYPILEKTYKNQQNSKNDRQKILLDQLNTAINITKIDGTLNITASNKGSTVLHSNSSNVLIDGVYTTYNVTPNGIWLPGKNAVFTVNAVSYSRIKIITENGISAYNYS